ncbi:PhnD/SsuA/transferrin family substrate-binding protein [Arthrobacter yangruifuii]|uniref:PhnD/SsuA/transferrin family substrate-binding protein n=1 Tax=Arthrobacter yangruifuii TaxID=2606616 RepID=A0A5N6ME51_9MICC|nr:ABC transporter substrate-binding protein [Arthrobacter yangruifuii]KAD3455943.1 PhnD/SsuA/transferrin family substrate-binding protein [Arthrobacter yangruifuii]
MRKTSHTHVSNRKSFKTAILALAGALALSACSGSATSAGGNPGSGGELQKVKFIVTQAAWSPSYAPLAAAKQLGYFEAEGYDVEFINLAGGTTTATQLEQGVADIAVMSPEPVVIGRSQGSFDAEYFALMMRRSHFGVAIPSGSTVSSAQGLAGKKIGVVSLASAGVQIAKGVAAEAGIDPNTLQFIEIGAGAQAIAAVRQGTVDALSMYDSQYQVMRNNDLDVQELESEFVNGLNAGGLAALPEKIDADPDMYIGVARAIFKGIHYCDTDPEGCVRHLWDMEPSTKANNLPEDQALANDVSVLKVRMEGSYVLEDGEDQWGAFPDGTWQRFVQYMKDSEQVKADVDPQSLYTDQLISQINDFDRAAVEADAQDN